MFRKKDQNIHIQGVNSLIGLKVHFARNSEKIRNIVGLFSFLKNDFRPFQPIFGWGRGYLRRGGG